MSGGEQRKVSILLPYAARPEVLLLDEPAGGLDPIARRELIDEIVDVISRTEACTILFSTHIISDLERIADTVGIMDRGRIITSAKLEDLQSRTKRVQVVFDGAEAPRGFQLPGAMRSKTEGPVVTAVVRLDYESVSRPNPKIIYAQATGFGSMGPDRDRAAFDDTVFWIRSGIMSTLGEPDGPPVPLPGASGCACGDW